MKFLGKGKCEPGLIWFTGLSGAGKTSLANGLAQRLKALEIPVYVLDGDKLRQGLCADLGFSDQDRSENIRRTGEVAKLFVDEGWVVLGAFISPFYKDRERLRRLLGADRFLEVHVATPLSVCEQRDPKGLYEKARRGDIQNFTGVDSPYEVPETPDLRLDLSRLSVEDGVRQLEQWLSLKDR